MSELKGSLIGIVLTIVIFITVGGILLKGYRENAQRVSDELTGQVVFHEPADEDGD